MADVPPPSLKHVKKYLDEAKARKAQDPVVSYHLRLYALQEAMEVRSKIPKEDMTFILALMDAVEAEKKSLPEMDESDKQAHCENFAFELFEKADNADRNGQSTLATAKVFNSAYHVMEACKQFAPGQELPEDMLEKIKYAKWRVVEIAKATKERRPPAPPRKLESNDEGGGVDAGVEGGGGAEGGGGSGGGGGGSGGADFGGGVLGGGGDPTMPTSYPPPPPPPPTDAVPPAAPDYFGLPPPPGVVPPVPVAGPQAASFDSSILPGAPQTTPPAYPGLAPPAGMPHGMMMPPPPPPPAQAYPPHMMMMPPPPPGYTPGRPQQLEAHKLCQSAQAALEFQDHATAVHALRQVLHMLTVPPAAPAVRSSE